MTNINNVAVLGSICTSLASAPFCISLVIQLLEHQGVVAAL